VIMHCFVAQQRYDNSIMMSLVKMVGSLLRFFLAFGKKAKRNGLQTVEKMIPILR
jgi:hypothetical protein